MAQQLPNDFPIDPVTTSGTALADVLNRQNEAINTNNAGATAPAVTFPGQMWMDTSVAPPVLRIRNAANSGWGTIPIAGDASGTPFLLPSGTVNAPGLAWAIEPGFGWYRKGTGDFAVASAGSMVYDFANSSAGQTTLSLYPRSPGTSGINLFMDPATTSGGRFLGVGFSGGTAYISATTGTVPQPITYSASQHSFFGPVTFADGVTGITNAMVGLDQIANQRQIINLRGTANAIYIGWNAGWLDAQVDADYFGAWWPINITGTAASANNSAALGGLAAAGWTQSDHITTVGLVGANALLPYVRRTADGMICQMVRNGSDAAQIQRDGININFMADSGAFIGGVATVGSDERMKENIEPLVVDVESYLRIKPISFTWRPDFAGANTGAQDGFSAQNVAQHLPRAIAGNFTTVDDEDRPIYAGLIDRAVLAHTVAHVQDLLNRVKSLESEMN